jgi:hypothetical protein
MRHAVQNLVLFSILLLCAAGVFAESAPFVTTFDEAATLAAKDNRNILIDFYTDW